MKKILLSLVCLGLFTTTLPAQSGGNVNVEFRTMVASGTPANLFYMNSNRPQALSGTPMVISGTLYRYSGEANMKLLRPGAAPERGGEAKMETVGTVAFPAGASGRYIMLLMGQADGTVTGSVVPDSAESFPNGSARLVNLSGLALTINCGGQTVPMRAGEFKIVDLKDLKGFVVGAFYMFNGEMTEIGNTILNNNPTSRCTVFFLLANGKQMREQPGTLPMATIFSYFDGPSASNNNRRGAPPPEF